MALQPLDAWAHHAVAHVMEMQGRPEDGIGWMITREAHWGAQDNFFKVHNWWHRALFHLDVGQMDEALALPTEESVRLALRTQQVIAHESGVTDTIDPLGGSFFVEALTDEVEVVPPKARVY